MSVNKILSFTFLSVLLLSGGCRYDKMDNSPEPDSQFPPDIADILVKKCATSGCHTPQSRSAAGELDFSTWEGMFEGGKNGSSVIPFSTEYSYLLYTVNTDSTRGPVLSPTMPYLQPPLSEEEYQTLYTWISNGAPDKNGFIKYSDNPQRKKIYICMQGCDQVAVMDAASKNIMRYIKVGIDPLAQEGPHEVRTSPDGQFWYVVFISGSVVQKFRCSDDSLIGTVNIGYQSWNTIVFSPDGKTGYVNAFQTSTIDYRTKVIDLESMTLVGNLDVPTPHGGFVTEDNRWFYLSTQLGNTINKIDLSAANLYDATAIDLIQGIPTPSGTAADPHQIEQSPDRSKYFVSCQGSAEVRVFRLSDDSLIAVIPVGKKPQEFSVSEKHPYIFVTCTEEPVSVNQTGKVYAINYNDLSLQGSYYMGFQPHGLAIDDEEDLLYVANLNYSADGDAPHHVTGCGGRDGYLTILNLNTMELYNKTLSNGTSFTYKHELLNFPYYVSIRK